MKPSSLEEAYRRLNSTITGNSNEAEDFLNSMQETKRKARGRQEQREKPKIQISTRQGYPSLLKRFRNG